MKPATLRQRILRSKACHPHTVFVRQHMAAHGTSTRLGVVTSLGTLLYQAARR